jgi:hypothetical protein
MITDAEKLAQIEKAWKAQQVATLEAAKALAAKDAPEDLQSAAIVRAIDAQNALNVTLEWAFK